MATIAQQPALHWRDRYIMKSRVISDSWQVFLAWAGAFAEIILFICMILSLAQMVLTLSEVFAGAVMIVQVITLDVAGFGLTSLAKSVRRAGDEETADKAATIGTIMITIMIISALSVAINHLFGAQRVGQYTIGQIVTVVDYILILSRVVMTVLYGKIMHALRDSQQEKQTVADETEKKLRDELAQAQSDRRKAQESTDQLTKQVTDLKKRLEETDQALRLSSGEQGIIITKLQNQVTQLNGQLQEKQQLSTDLQSAKATIYRLQVAEQQSYTLAETVKRQEQTVKDLSEKLSQSEQKCESLGVKLHNERVKAQGEKSVKAGVKASQNQPANITSIDQARAKSKTDEAAVLAYIQSSPDVKVPQVAEHFGVTTRTIYNILKRQQDGESDGEGEAVSQS